MADAAMRHPALRQGWVVYVWVTPGATPGMAQVDYVGCSSDYGRPFRGEAKRRGVTEIWLREFKTSWMAKAAEKLFIEALKPILNVAHSEGARARRQVRAARVEKQLPKIGDPAWMELMAKLGWKPT